MPSPHDIVIWSLVVLGVLLVGFLASLLLLGIKHVWTEILN